MQGRYVRFCSSLCFGCLWRPFMSASLVVLDELRPQTGKVIARSQALVILTYLSIDTFAILLKALLNDRS